MKSIEETQQDQYRLHYHLMPAVGSLADPNGMCQINGITHIYFVYNPLACKTRQKTACVWGHYSTKDFIHFQYEKIAIEPDHQRDRDGVYSGCAFYHNQTLYMFYTGNVRHQGDYDYIHQGREQNVLRVSSQDAIQFDHKRLLMTNDNFPKNMTQHVRDPMVFCEDEHYYMILGARSYENIGCVLVYESQDMMKWTYINEITTSQSFGYMWECPDMIQFDQTRFLITCPQGVKQDTYHYQNAHQCGYFEVVGDFKSDCKLSEFEQFDYGFDFYAARTFLDEQGQRILVGWMGMPETSYSENLTYQNGWMQCLAMPRVLTYYNHHIYQNPMKQMQALRQNHESIDLKNGLHKHCLCFEMIIQYQQMTSFSMKLREDCDLVYHQQMLTLTMDTCGDGRHQRSVYIDKLFKLQIFSDTSSLEIFINDGYYTMTSRLFGQSDDILIKECHADVDFYELSSYQIQW